MGATMTGEAVFVALWLAAGLCVWLAANTKSMGPWVSVMHLFMIPVVMIVWPIFLLAWLASAYEERE